MTTKLPQVLTRGLQVSFHRVGKFANTESINNEHRLQIGLFNLYINPVSWTLKLQSFVDEENEAQRE